MFLVNTMLRVLILMELEPRRSLWTLVNLGTMSLIEVGHLVLTAPKGCDSMYVC